MVGAVPCVCVCVGRLLLWPALGCSRPVLFHVGAGGCMPALCQADGTAVDCSCCCCCVSSSACFAVSPPCIAAVGLLLVWVALRACMHVVLSLQPGGAAGRLGMCRGECTGVSARPVVARVPHMV